ncbi:conjugal transfer protein (plasmid) [Streptomyces sp. SDT5-1]|uniref:conjugal transfer protein n=1 Tax=Streptomyces sp. SDT5-1 TaxID=3406418 RepID=UPI003FD4CC5A
MPAPVTEAPPAAAGLELERTRRSVRLGRAGVWLCLLAGPAALCVALTRPSATVVTQSPSPDAAARPAASASSADPSGYAAEFVDAWLRSSDAEPDSAAAARARRFAPSVALPQPADQAKAPQSVAAVRSVQRGGGQWSVTVAARYTDQVRYLSVPVTASGSGDAVTVTGAPAIVAAPAAAKTRPSDYTVEVPDGPLTDTVGDFLTAYLSGSGEVDRYLAPKTSLAAVSPEAADEVDVETVTAREDRASAEQVPGDGTLVHVEAGASVHTRQGVLPLTYELTLAARGGRWEIAALTSGGGEAK